MLVCGSGGFVYPLIRLCFCVLEFLYSVCIHHWFIELSETKQAQRSNLIRPQHLYERLRESLQKGTKGDKSGPTGHWTDGPMEEHTLL